MKEEFTTMEVCRIFGIKRECLRQWMMMGLVRPSIRIATGRGDKNLFSFDDLVRLRVFKTLRDFGLSRKRSAEIANVFEHNDPDKYEKQPGPRGSIIYELPLKERPHIRLIFSFDAARNDVLRMVKNERG